MSRSKWLVVAWALLAAAIPTARTYANISEAAVLFLRIASGARPAGMGEAFVALADDATATHWNPAGLGRYPLSDLWMNVPVPRDRTIARFAVVENDVPERNYTRYDMWILTQASAGYFESDEFDNPRVTPVSVPPEGITFRLVVDGQESSPITVAGGAYATPADLEQAVQKAIDAVLLESGVRATVMPSGDRSRLRITSGTTGDRSNVKVLAEAPPPYLAGNRLLQGNDPELLRATPPSHNARAGASELSAESEFSARVDYGIWKTGDVYEPDATENLLGILRSRTGLPEGEELSFRVAQVARLNQLVPTDSLRRAWDNVKALAKNAVPETLTVNMQTLFDANDVLNTDPGYLADLIDEMQQVVQSGRFEDDDAFRLQVLAGRAVVTYLPEKITFPFALNLPGQVTALDSRDKTLYVGTTRGVLMYVDGRSVALADTAAGPARGVIHDLKVSPAGSIWVGTEEGVSRYSPTWTHFGVNQGWDLGAAQKIFVLGENDIFAYGDGELARFDAEAGSWIKQFTYQTTLGEEISKLPGRIFGLEDSVLATAWADSLQKYNALDPGELPAGTTIRIPYHLALRGDVTSLARTADGVLWIGTTKGVVSVGTDNRVQRYGYTLETVDSATALLAVAQKFVGDDPDRAALLAARIKSDNYLDGDVVAAGRKIEVFSAVPGSTIQSLQAEGKHVLAGTEYGTVEYRGEGEWYRYTDGNLEDYQVSAMSERSGERWFAAADRVVVYGKPRKEITFMHVKWLPTLADDLYYEFFGGVMPIKGWGTMGANITFLSLGTQTRVDEFGNVLGEFGTFELAATLSYGTRLAPTLAAGLSAKIVYSHLADQGAGAEQGQGTATGLALDLGTIWNTPLKRLDLGVAITNVGPDISYIDAAQADPLPRNLAVGLAYRLIHTPYNKLTLVGEVNKDLIGWREDLGEQLDEAIFNGGLEYQYGSFIALRGGYIYDRQGDIKKPTLGAGIQYKIFQFDFAYIPSSSSNQPLDNTTRLSLSVRW